jgi:hypothetical protein
MTGDLCLLLLEQMERYGNARARGIWEARVPRGCRVHLMPSVEV